MNPEQRTDVKPCQLCREMADVTWPGERGGLPLCKTCVLGILPRIMADSALAGVKRHECWQEARKCYDELRSTYWNYVCDELDEIPEGLFDEDDVPEKVIERENREWDRRQAYEEASGRLRTMVD